MSKSSFSEQVEVQNRRGNIQYIDKPRFSWKIAMGVCKYNFRPNCIHCINAANFSSCYMSHDLCVYMSVVWHNSNPTKWLNSCNCHFGFDCCAC